MTTKMIMVQVVGDTGDLTVAQCTRMFPGRKAAGDYAKWLQAQGLTCNVGNIELANLNKKDLLALLFNRDERVFNGFMDAIKVVKGRKNLTKAKLQEAKDAPAPKIDAFPKALKAKTAIQKPDAESAVKAGS